MLDIKAYAISNGLQWSSVLMNVSRWQRQGLIERVRRGVYLLRDAEVNALTAACSIIPDGYLSLEYAMSHYGMILDRIYRIDIACARRVKGFSIRGTEIVVTKIPSRLYWGWEVTESLHGPVRIATPEKALFDRIYLDRHAVPQHDYFEEMGLQFEKVNLEVFTELAARSPKVRRFCGSLEEYCHGQ